MHDDYQTLQCTAQVPSSWSLTEAEKAVLANKMAVALVLMLPDRLWPSASERFDLEDPPIIECLNLGAAKQATKQAKKKKKK